MAELPDRIDLATQIGDVTEVHDLRPGGDISGEDIDNLLRPLELEGNGDLLENYPVTTRPLLPGGQHARIVLIGRQNLISRFEVESKLAVLE